ncbi:MAG: sugar kinase [Labrenzia sp.]
MVDLLCIGEPLFELNEQPDGSILPGCGGDVSNVCIAASRQQAYVGLIANIGADTFGEKLQETWRREGVSTKYVTSKPGEDTGIYFVQHDANGHKFLYRRKGSAASRMTREDIPQSAIADASLVYASGISLAVSGELRDATRHAIEIAVANGRAVAFDPNLRTALWSLDEARAMTHEVMKRCDIALPGLDDARALTGHTSPEEIVRFYHSLGARVVALTLGADGVAVSCGDGVKIIPGEAVETVDATGAGDCFNGVFMAAWLRSGKAVEGAAIANRAAAHSTTAYGAVTAPRMTLSS